MITRNKMLSMPGIYAIDFPKGCYIGSSKNMAHRMMCHRSALKNGKHGNPKLQNAFNKYKNFEELALLVCEEKYLLMFEQLFISAFKPRYNLSSIAGKVEMTKSVLKKIYAWRFDKKKSSKAFKKISKALKGRPLSKEQRINIGIGQKGRKAWNKGIPLTKQHKLALRKGWARKKRRTK